MKRRYTLFLFCMVSVLALAGCKKQETITETNSIAQTVEINEDVADDKFAVNETFHAATVEESKPLEQVEKDNKEVRESVESLLEAQYETMSEEELSEITEEESLRNLEVEVTNEAGEEEVETVDMYSSSDGYFEVLIDKIIFKELTSLEAVYTDIEKHMAGEPDGVVTQMKHEAKDLLAYWKEVHEKVDNQPNPWTKEEIEKNPLIVQYTREEMAEMDKAIKEAGFE